MASILFCWSVLHCLSFSIFLETFHFVSGHVMTEISIVKCFSEDNKNKSSSCLSTLSYYFTLTFLGKWCFLFLILVQLWGKVPPHSVFACVSCMKNYQGIFFLLRLCPHGLRALLILWFLNCYQMQSTFFLESLFQYLTLLRPWPGIKKSEYECCCYLYHLFYLSFRHSCL